MRATWTGRCTSPQYHVRSVKRSSDAGNATGNAKFLKVFFREGYMEICRNVSVISQLSTAKICCSGGIVSLIPSRDF